MKTKLTLLFAITFSFFAQAQQECLEKLSLMGTSYKANDIESAYQYLQELRKDCPTVHKGLYSYGERILMKKIIDANGNAEQVKAFAQDLNKLYDENAANFPETGKAGLDMKKGLTLFNYNVGTQEETFNYFDTAFKNDLANFDSTRALYAYFEMIVNNHNAGKSGFELQDVFDKYDDISEKLDEVGKADAEALDALISKTEAGQELTGNEEKYKAKYERNIEDIANVKTSMDAIIVELSTCEKLIPFYRKSFEANKSNELWLKRASDRLNAKGCDSDPLFSEISMALFKLNPSADAAYKLGVVEYQRGNTSKALEYFNQAAGLYQDGAMKAKVYLGIATMYQKSNKSQARSYAEKALQARPSYGKARLFLAGLYGSNINDAGGDNFQRRAMYWLAAQEAEKASAIDPSVRAKANSLASKYRAAAPSKTEIFNHPDGNMSGKQVCFGSWISRCVTVPKL
ncbi:tetratricopeptide repeat protein [Flavobacterium sp.]|uniref:tetratricopeptide repeat protein n=1 Tax=Flavobacterium sp. TaxID=239 RepID=UPI003528CD7B